FTLSKTDWDSVSLERVEEAIEGSSASAEVVALMVQHGLANLCVLSGGMTITKARLDVQVPKKGSAADAFWDWMCREANKRDLRDLILSKPKWVLAHASSAHKHSLKEVLAESAVSARVADTKAVSEVLALKSFFDMMAVDPLRVTYGYRYVLTASNQGAIDKLLITDNLFRVQNVQERRQYVELIEGAKAGGSKVHIFSSMHISGEQLAKQGGIAAILRFPLPIDDLVAEIYGDAADASSASSSDSDSSDSEALVD
ncbi:MAG: hypothetical protein SGPRY_008818, partial [Prymnesium sp.]